jgi:hypothetical protein
MNGEAGDGVPNILPVVQPNPSAVVQWDPSPVVQSDLSPIVLSDPSAFEQSGPPVVQPLVVESRRTSKQRIVTAPTANRRKRRKPQRSWALLKVMALDECVARCDVEKWAEITKLGFSWVGYRNVDDLKVSLLGWCYHFCYHVALVALLLPSYRSSRNHSAAQDYVICVPTLMTWEKWPPKILIIRCGPLLGIVGPCPV